MSTETKMMDSVLGPLVIAGWILLILSLILCVTALLISGNPLYFVFGVTAVSLLGIVAALLQDGNRR